MATVAPPISHKHGFSREETRVIFASSLGTVFEWYDFYLYATLAPFFAALFFPTGNDDRGAAVGVRDVRGRLPGAAVRRAGVRADRRPRRAQVHVPRHDPGHGLLDVRRRPAADVRVDRLGGADPARQPAPAAGPGARRRVRRRGDLRRGARGRRQARLRHGWIQTTATLGLFLALLVIGLCRFTGWMTPAQFADWGWRLPFLVSLILLIFSVYIRLKLNESPVFQRMKAEGKGSKAPLTRQLPQVSEQQVRAARAARRDGGPGRRLVHGAVLRAVLPDDHAEGRRRRPPTR